MTVEPASVAEVTTRFPWPAMKVYDINAPGTTTACSSRPGLGRYLSPQVSLTTNASSKPLLVR